MANDQVRRADATVEKRDKSTEQIETILMEIVRKHPRLKEAREAVLRSDEPADKFAREFLQVFRQRLQGT